MAFKQDDRVVAARKALTGAKKSARKDRGTGMPQAKESGGLFDAEGEAERKDQIQAGRELAVARGVRPGTERPTPMFENIPKEFDPDFEDEFVMEGEATKQAPFKGVGGYSYTQNAAGDYEFVGPDGKKGVAKKGTKAHASIFSEMTGKGSLYKKTGSSGGTSSRSAPAQTTPKSPAAASKARTAKAASAAMGAASQPKRAPEDSETDVDAIIDAAAPPQSMDEEVALEKSYADEYDEEYPESFEGDMVTPPSPIPEVPVTSDMKYALEVRVPQQIRDLGIIQPDNVSEADFVAASRAAYMKTRRDSAFTQRRNFTAEMERLLGVDLESNLNRVRTTSTGFVNMSDEEAAANQKALEQAQAIRAQRGL